METIWKLQTIKKCYMEQAYREDRKKNRPLWQQELHQQTTYCRYWDELLSSTVQQILGVIKIKIGNWVEQNLMLSRNNSSKMLCLQIRIQLKRPKQRKNIFFAFARKTRAVKQITLTWFRNEERAICQTRWEKIKLRCRLKADAIYFAVEHLGK